MVKGLDLFKGISPVITSMILIGAVLVIGLSFMSYAILLTNIQRSEVVIRNILAEEASKVIMYLENDRRGDSNIVAYVGIAKLINEPSAYYLAVFKANQYELAAKKYTPIDANISIFNSSTPGGYGFQRAVGTPVSSSNVYTLSTSGDYMPLGTELSLYVYEIPYTHTTLIKIECSSNVVGVDNYLVIMLLVRIDGDYYELLQLSYRV